MQAISKKTKTKAKKETFQGVFSRYGSKKTNSYQETPGLYLKAICKLRTKKIIINEQWFAIGKNFKEMVGSYDEETLQGKTIQFKAVQEAHPKGYFEYRDNVLIGSPEDLEYKLFRPSNIKVL